MKRKLVEQEETITDLAMKLEGSMKLAHELREIDVHRGPVWMKDEDVKDCFRCEKEFSTLRRKHHCRK